MKRTLLIASLCLMLSACGFKPVYGTYPTSGKIQVLEIEGRTGHRLRQELNRTLSSGLPNVEDGAYLEVSVAERFSGLSLRQDAGETRSTLSGNANYTLYSFDGKVLQKGSTSVQTDYDVTNSEYGDIALQTDARERVAYLLSRRIYEQLVLGATDEKASDSKQTESDVTPSDEDLVTLQ